MKKKIVFSVISVIISIMLIIGYYVFSDRNAMNGISEVQEYHIPNKDDFNCNNFTPGIQDAKIHGLLSDSDIKNKHTVIVIGAGISGIEAGHQLQRNNIDVLILEARDRIGGRVWTSIMNGTAIDLGGSWIHGLNEQSSIQSPTFKIAKKNGIETVKTYQTTTLYNYTGKKINDYSYDIIDKYDRFAEKYDESLTDAQRQKLNVKDVLNMFYSKGGLSPEEKTIFDYTMQWNFDMEQAENVTNTSFAKSMETQYFEGDEDNEVVFLHGYNQITNCLAQGLNIKHSIVKEIDYGNDTINIVTNNGTFHSKYVISTLPVPVLQGKTNMTVKFIPPLKSKQAALNGLYMGTMDKVYLLYDKPFWDSSAWINRVAQKGNSTDEKWQFFFNIYKYDGKPILLAFNTGESAKQIENKIDNQIIDEVVSVLKKMYPDSPRPKEWKITRWASDPFAGGSYSIVPPNGSVDSALELAKPVDNKLFFAGEATTKYYYGTVHGGYITGYRAAEEVIKTENENLLDVPLEQIRHGIKNWDVICKRGYESVVDESTEDNVKCQKIN